jgi:hypothetical protein
MTDSVAFRIDGLPSEEAISHRSRAICEEIGETQALITTLGWDALRDSAASTLREEVAKQDGLDWLSWAWTKSKELKKAAAETLDGVPERCVKLASHSLSQKVVPTVTLRCGGLELEFEFTLKLSADVECVDLVVQHGCLVALRAGSLTPSAVLSFKGIEISHIEGDPINFPEHRLSGDGLRIVDERPAASS